MCCATEPYSFSPKEKSATFFVCEAEMSEMKACVYRCATWKAHQGLFNGTAEQPCPITCLSEITELQKRAVECGDETGLCGSAQCGEVYTPRSDREVLVQQQ